MSNLVRDLTELCAKKKELRASAIGILREMDSKDLTILEREGPQKQGLARKVFHYPGDLSEQRLLDLLKKKAELGL